MTEQGWRFGDYPGATRDAVNGATYLHEIYTLVDPRYTGRATVPALWDKKRFRDTFNLDHIKRGYYSITSLNPTRIVPLGPELAWAPAR
jgi:glutathionyl-hydroquinone reductase